MSFSNLSLMRASRTMLSPFWGVGVLVAFVYVLIVGVPQNLLDPFGGLFTVLLAGPLTLGLAIFSRSIFRNESPHFNQLFDGFRGPLIIPGIIVSLGLGLTFYVMADRPDLSFTDCLQESWRIMDGYKLKFLGLNLRFIPWYFLGLLCLGVGILVVIPWHYVTIAGFYEKVKESRTN